MSRMGWMLVGALAVLAALAMSTAYDRIAEWLVSSRDRAQQIDRTINGRLRGRFGEFVPLGPHEEPTESSNSPRVMPPWPPLRQQPAPLPVPAPRMPAPMPPIEVVPTQPR